jgi:hypothetical protein
MEARGHAIVLFSAAPDRGRWVSVMLLPAGKRAVLSLSLLRSNSRRLPPRPVPLSPLRLALRRPRFHFSIKVVLCSSAPRLAPAAGSRELVKSSKSTDVQAPPSSHSTDSDRLGIVWSHEGSGMPINPMSLHASFRHHKRRAAGTPPSVTDRADSEYAYCRSRREYA